MELIISAIIAPLWIALIVWAFKRRSLVWFFRPISSLVLSGFEGKYIQEFVIWNAGGQLEDAVGMEISEDEEARLAAASKVVRIVDGVIELQSMKPGERVSVFLLLSKKTAGNGVFTVSSKHQAGRCVSADNEVVTSHALGVLLTILLIIAALGCVFIRWAASSAPTDLVPVATQALSNPVKNVEDIASTTPKAEGARHGWDSTGSIDQGAIAKFYPAPSYPLIVSPAERKAGLMTVQVIAINSTDAPITIQLSLKATYEGKPDSISTKEFFGDTVLSPGTQRIFELSTWAPVKYAGELTVLDTWVSYRDELISGRKYVSVPN